MVFEKTNICLHHLQHQPNVDCSKQRLLLQHHWKEFEFERLQASGGEKAGSIMPDLCRMILTFSSAFVIGRSLNSDRLNQEFRFKL